MNRDARQPSGSRVERRMIPHEPLSYPTHVRFGRYLGRIGGALLPLYEQRAERIAADLRAGRLGYFDQLLVAGAVSQLKRKGRLGELAILSEAYWAGDGVTAYHARAESRFEQVFLQHHAAILPHLERLVAARADRYATLCEIGCGAGRVLEHVAGRLPQLADCVGIDLSAAQIARNRQRYAATPRLRFEAADAAAWIERHAGPRWIYFACGGVLEYFPRDKLQRLLATLASPRMRPALLACVEPLADGHDIDAAAGSVVYGDENTFSHDYPRLVEAAGLQILHREEPLVGRQRWLMLIAEAR